jgi:hypothetical protein
MTFQTQCVVCFDVVITDSLVMVRAPFKKPFVPDRFPLGAFTLVFRVNSFAEVLAVREEQQDTIGIKASLQLIDVFLEATNDFLEVTVDSDYITTPIKFLLIDLTPAVRIVVSINAKLGLNDNRPKFLRLLLPLRGGL